MSVVAACLIWLHGRQAIHRQYDAAADQLQPDAVEATTLTITCRTYAHHITSAQARTSCLAHCANYQISFVLARNYKLSCRPHQAAIGRAALRSRRLWGGQLALFRSLRRHWHRCWQEGDWWWQEAFVINYCNNNNMVSDVLSCVACLFVYSDVKISFFNLFLFCVTLTPY